MCAMGGDSFNYVHCTDVPNIPDARYTRAPVRVAVLVCQSVFSNTKTSLLYFVLYFI